MKPTVISTFAGCGGSSLGYHWVGFDERLAVEWENNAVETFKLNFPDVPVYHGDIAQLSADECLRLAGLEKGELDVFDGSPPCQGFSTAGKRKYNDPRNSLFIEFARLLNDLQPKTFVMENVTGMVKGYMKQAYLQIMKTLRECGYNAKGQVLNAKYFNVPQSRERVIVIGVREDLGVEPSHPYPKNKPIRFKEAIRGLQQYDEEERGLPEILLKYAKQHPGGWNTNNKIYYNIKGSIAGAMSTKWLEWNKICGTLPKSEISSTGIVHPNKERYINLTEAKRIASFPDDFSFLNRKDGIARIGNSVPPKLAQAIAEHIKSNILDEVNNG